MPFPLHVSTCANDPDALALAQSFANYGGLLVHIARLSPDFADLRLSDLNVKALAQSGATCSPVVSCHGNSGPLCGRYLIEAQARWLELDYLLQLTRDSSLVSRIDSRLSQSPEYVFAFDFFAEHSDPQRRIEFSFAIDLALDTEIVPVSQDEQQYRHSHPGYRFLDIVRALPDVEPLNINVDDLGSEVRRFLQDLATHAELRSPYDKAKDELAMWSAQHRDDLQSGKLLADHDVLRTEAVKQRLEIAWFFAFPHIRQAEWSQGWKRLPSLYTAIDGALLSSGAYGDAISEQYRNSKLVELMIGAWTRQILGYRTEKCKPGMIECGVSYFDVKRTCPYGDECPGVFDPRDGVPVPITKNSSSSRTTGCPFGLYSITQQVSLDAIDVKS